MENGHEPHRARRPTYPSPDTQGFASLLYVMFIVEKRYRVEVVAPQLDRSPSALYGYIEGRQVFPPDLIAPLYLATRDRRVLAFFLDEAGVCFYELPELDESECGQGVWRQALKAQREHLEVMERLTLVLEDGVITSGELSELTRRISEAQTEMARLHACARILSRRGRRPAKQEG